MPYSLFVRSLKTERVREDGNPGEDREVAINQELKTEDSDLITFATRNVVCF
jgi:hypothetical protein